MVVVCDGADYELAICGVEAVLWSVSVKLEFVVAPAIVIAEFGIPVILYGV